MNMNKKLLSSAVVALLVLSMLAAAVPTFAAPAAAPTLDVNTGAPGTKVNVSGADGVNEANPFSTVTVYWDSISGPVLGTVGANNLGEYDIDVVIPSATTGTHYIVVGDGTGGALGTAFTVTSDIVVSTTPETDDSTYEAKVLPGDTLTITGNGFAGSTATVPKPIDITIASAAKTLTFNDIVNTNSTGSFSVTVTIPSSELTAADYDDFTVTATDGTSPATALILIDYYAAVNPVSGPAGVTATITGRIQGNAAYVITIAGQGVASTQIGTGTSSAIGAFSNEYTIPTILAAQLYTITVTFGSGPSTVTTQLTVSIPPTASLSANSGLVGAEITVTGANFVPKANMCILFNGVVVNSTADDARFKKSTAGGAVSNKFNVPDLAPGKYTVTLQDEFGATAEISPQFTIRAEAVTTIDTRSEIYTQGSTISFIISSTDENFANVKLTIKDEAGKYWWGYPGAELQFNPVAQPDASKEVIFAAQVDLSGNHFVLPADAPVGTWNWTVTYTATPGAKQASGLFDVVAAGSTAVIDAINDLKGTIESIQGDVVIIKTSVGTSLATTLSAIQGKVTSIENGVATISTPDLGAITTKLSSIDAVLGSVAGDVATLKTSVGDVTTTLTALNAKVVSIENGIATITTDVGTLQGVVTQIQGDVASIDTGVGTITANVANLQPKVEAANNNTSSMSTMIYVAVAFAVIAAIAAVASILLMRKKIAS